MESVDIDADEKDGQVVEPASEMQVSDMMSASSSQMRSAALLQTSALSILSSNGQNLSTETTAAAPRERFESSKSNRTLGANFLWR